jgi:serine phosphatase RsbU (regulator of sigma subunit)
VAGIYSREWPETRKVLMADHRGSIEEDPKGVRRLVKTSSAVLYGLAKRLAPHRRVLFVLAWISFFLCLFSLFTQMDKPPVATFVEVAATFVVMTLLLAMELIDKLKFRDELELARDLQANLIPAHPAQNESYEIAAFNHIANTVGGDIYDFVPLADGRMGVLFGDASGHGMAAGLVMAVAHAAFRTQLDIDPSPSSIISSLNRILCRTGGTRSFFSCLYLLLSPNGEFVAVLAGHPQILKIDRTGKVVGRIGEGSYPLGIKLTTTWNEIRGCLAPGERLLLHSDGLTEARNDDGREFGDAYVESIVGWHPNESAPRLIETITGEWKLFAGGHPAEDDVSIAVIERKWLSPPVTTR